MTEHLSLKRYCSSNSKLSERAGDWEAYYIFYNLHCTDFYDQKHNFLCHFHEKPYNISNMSRVVYKKITNTYLSDVKNITSTHVLHILLILHSSNIRLCYFPDIFSFQNSSSSRMSITSISHFCCHDMYCTMSELASFHRSL